MNGRNHEEGRKLAFSFAMKEKWRVLEEHNWSHICLLLRSLIVEHPRLNLSLTIQGAYHCVYVCCVFIVFLNVLWSGILATFRHGPHYSLWECTDLLPLGMLLV